MRTARRHPQVGWLHLQGQDYSRSLDRLLLERDRLDDLTHSGPAPAYMAWVWAEELPALARQQHYRNQIHDHIADLEQQHTELQQTIAQGRLDLGACCWPNAALRSSGCKHCSAQRWRHEHHP
jgi:hypothetical protein